MIVLIDVFNILSVLKVDSHIKYKRSRVISVFIAHEVPLYSHFNILFLGGIHELRTTTNDVLELLSLI